MILDAFSRRGIGWALGRTLEGDLTVAALRMALVHRQPLPGMIHHSDGGVQYAAREYVDLVLASEIRPSMSRPGVPTDNATCERFIRTLKQGEVYLRDYDDFYDAQRSIERFIEVVYNHKRHSALGYVPPAEFERSLSEPPKLLALT